MKQYISLETLVKPQIGDPFGPALDKIHTAIKEECLKFTNKYDYEEYVDEGHMDQYYSAISKLVKDRLVNNNLFLISAKLDLYHKGK